MKNLNYHNCLLKLKMNGMRSKIRQAFTLGRYDSNVGTGQYYVRIKRKTAGSDLIQENI